MKGNLLNQIQTFTAASSVNTPILGPYDATLYADFGVVATVSSAITSTLVIEGSNDQTNWTNLKSLSITANGSYSVSLVPITNKFLRTRLLITSGTSNVILSAYASTESTGGSNSGGSGGGGSTTVALTTTGNSGPSSLNGTPATGYTLNIPVYTGTTSVRTVSGNIVNNADPVNPVVTQVQPDWNASTGVGAILNKPTIPATVTVSAPLLKDANSNITLSVDSATMSTANNTLSSTVGVQVAGGYAKTLVAGTNISLSRDVSGNVTIAGSGGAGGITDVTGNYPLSFATSGTTRIGSVAGANTGNQGVSTVAQGSGLKIAGTAELNGQNATSLQAITGTNQGIYNFNGRYIYIAELDGIYSGTSFPLTKVFPSSGTEGDMTNPAIINQKIFIARESGALAKAGGLITSTDGLVFAATQPFGNIYATAIGAGAIDPISGNRDILVFSTGQAGNLFKSTDNGTTFTTAIATSGLPTSGIADSFYDDVSGVLWIGHSTGIYACANYKATTPTFTKPVTNTGVNRIRRVFNKIFFLSNQGIWSVNIGDNATPVQIYSDGSGFRDVAISNATLIAGTNNGVRYSRTNGTGWSAQTSGAVIPSVLIDTNRVLATRADTGNQGIWQSTSTDSLSTLATDIDTTKMAINANGKLSALLPTTVGSGDINVTPTVQTDGSIKYTVSSTTPPSTNVVVNGSKSYGSTLSIRNSTGNSYLGTDGLPDALGVKTAMVWGTPVDEQNNANVDYADYAGTGAANTGFIQAFFASSTLTVSLNPNPLTAQTVFQASAIFGQASFTLKGAYVDSNGIIWAIGSSGNNLMVVKATLTWSGNTPSLTYVRTPSFTLTQSGSFLNQVSSFSVDSSGVANTYRMVATLAYTGAGLIAQMSYVDLTQSGSNLTVGGLNQTPGLAPGALLETIIAPNNSSAGSVYYYIGDTGGRVSIVTNLSTGTKTQFMQYEPATGAQLNMMNTDYDATGTLTALLVSYGDGQIFRIPIDATTGLIPTGQSVTQFPLVPNFTFSSVQTGSANGLFADPDIDTDIQIIANGTPASSYSSDWWIKLTQGATIALNAPVADINGNQGGANQVFTPAGWADAYNPIAKSSLYILRETSTASGSAVFAVGTRGGTIESYYDNSGVIPPSAGLSVFTVPAGTYEISIGASYIGAGTGSVTIITNFGTNPSVTSNGDANNMNFTVSKTQNGGDSLGASDSQIFVFTNSVNLTLSRFAGAGAGVTTAQISNTGNYQIKIERLK